MNNAIRSAVAVGVVVLLALAYIRYRPAAVEADNSYPGTITQATSTTTAQGSSPAGKLSAPGIDPTQTASGKAGVDPTQGANPKAGVDSAQGANPKAGIDPTQGANPKAGIDPTQGPDPKAGIDPTQGPDPKVGPTK